MSWIKTIPFEKATGKLLKIYQKVAGPNNNVDNVLKIHSLRPHSLEGHMKLYKNVLHHHNNTLPKWYLESLGTYVSHLNECNYCVQHHAEGLKRLLKEEKEKFEKIKKGIEEDQPVSGFNEKELNGFVYAKKLTLNHKDISQKDIEELRRSGYDDGEILEINQVVSYFNYVNRTVVGLGVDVAGDVLGLSPNDNNDPNDWSHK